MKRTMTLIVALMAVATLYAEEPYKAYCTLSALHSGQTFVSLSRVEVDFGQGRQTKNYLVDEYGKALNYNTVTAAANHLSRYGWVLEDSYVVGEDNVRCVWVMSKMVTDESQITEGFQTRLMYENGGPHPIN